MYTLLVILVSILCLMIGFVMGLGFCEGKLSEAKDLAIKSKRLSDAILKRDHHNFKL